MGHALMFKYIIRPLDLALLVYVIGVVASTIGSSVDEVFVSLEIWGSSWDDTLKADVRAGDNHDKEAFIESGVLEVDEMVDLQSIRDYRDLCIDRRQDAQESFIQIHGRNGIIDDRGLSTLRQVYAKWKISRPPLGRKYGRCLTLHHMARGARGAAWSIFAIDIKFVNSRPNFIAESLPPGRRPCLLRFTKHPKERKAAPSAYYGCSAAEPKKILLRRISGSSNPQFPSIEMRRKCTF